MLSAFLKRLLFTRQFFIINGKVEVLNVQLVMLPPDVIFEIQNLDEKKSYDIGKKIAHDNMRLFAKKLGTSSEGILKDIQDIYETFGLGAMQIADLDQSKKRAIIRIKDSPTANLYLEKNKKKSSKAICIFISAFLAGTFSFLFNTSVDSVEKNCLAQGKDYCEFIIQSKQSKKIEKIKKA
ncbi:hypothetical protein HYX18_02520 [Candidatus Woesearchaeota archaeon]|nr:hypothetical protein [Candidatus Woesearchaeota archaeon]